jgi:hypothetical protein
VRGSSQPLTHRRQAGLKTAGLSVPKQEFGRGIGAQLAIQLSLQALGVEAIKKWADTGEKPAPTPGKAFFDTGVNLVTDKPATGVPSIDTAKGMELCWG